MQKVAAFVLPLHPPKYAYAVDLLQSLVWCGQAPTFDVFLTFSSTADQAAWHERLQWDAINFGGAANEAHYRSSVHEHVVDDLPTQAMTFAKGSDSMARSTPSLVAFKKIRGIEHVFRTTEHEYVICSDSESLFQSAAFTNLRERLRNWSEQRLLVGSSLYRSNLHMARVVNASCAVAGLEPPAPDKSGDPMAMPHFSDVPIFQRGDFLDFLGRVRLPAWSNSASLLAARPRLLPNDTHLIFENIAYACYKVQLRNWRLFDAAPTILQALRLHDEYRHRDLERDDLMLEAAGSLMQNRLTRLTGYHFLWSRDENEHRLLQFHLDRNASNIFGSVGVSHARGCAPEGSTRGWTAAACCCHEREKLKDGSTCPSPCGAERVSALTSKGESHYRLVRGECRWMPIARDWGSWDFFDSSRQ